MQGVEVTIVTWNYDSYGYGDSSYWMKLHEDMRKAGFYMKTVENVCSHFAIVDQEIVWYGSINFLGKEDVEDSVMRVKEKKIANELMVLMF